MGNTQQLNLQGHLGIHRLHEGFPISFTELGLLGLLFYFISLESFCVYCIVIPLSLAFQTTFCHNHTLSAELPELQPNPQHLQTPPQGP